MSAFNETAPTTTAPPGTDYVGRTYYYLRDPAASLAAGYDRIRVYRRNGPADSSWVPITNAATDIVIEPGKVNYLHLETKAKKTHQYRPSLLDSTGVQPEVPQINYVQDAVDTSYESIITTQELRDFFMWGLLGLFQDDDGVQFPERLYVHYIRYGIAKFERKTRIRALPYHVVGEMHDYSPGEWVNRYWSFLLDEFPCLPINPTVTLTLPGGQPFVVPDSWIRFEHMLGIVNIVPDGNYPATPANPFPRLSMGLVPCAFKIDYVAGFPLGQLPTNLKDMIAKEASSGPLNLGGDLVGGAAIASQSMSLDGLSQSVNTTSSATNSGFGSRLIQYNNELKRDYPVVEKYYKGPRLYVG